MGSLKRWISRTPLARNIIYFFPVQLLLVQFKKNPVLIIFWLLLFGFLTGSIAARYGLAWLFVDPEYLGTVDFRSYFLVGFASGGFILAYQISCYIHNAYRFPFLATLSYPFLKFSLNNIVIPALFLFVYVYRIIHFLADEPITNMDRVLNLLGFLLGNFTFAGIGFFWFYRAGHDLEDVMSAAHIARTPKTKRVFLRRNIIRDALEWKTISTGREARDWHVETYLSLPWRLRRARPFEHYDKYILNRVFRQNHVIAVVFELVVILTLLLFGLFRDVRWLMIPAGASVFLLFTLYLMFSGILYTWFRGWTNVALVSILLLINYLHQFDLFGNKTRATGMNYATQLAPYNAHTLNGDFNREEYRNDSLHTIRILENWKAKQQGDSLHKPKLIVLQCSGGGIRSALWTLYTMQYLDSISNSSFLNQTALICGSSGGMVGAACLREVQWRQQKGENVNTKDVIWRERISNDLLNPMAFSLAVNDWFLPLRSASYKGQQYSRNRAWAFEEELEANTGIFKERLLTDYTQAESDAVIPMMVFAPTIVNDGRRLLIASHPVSYMLRASPEPHVNQARLTDGVEFMRFFKNQGADQVRFASVLRMNATFPYITPITTLPSNPEMEVFDAGMRDNYGITNTIRFLHQFRHWIAANTSGVVLVQTRDKSKARPILDEHQKTIMQDFSRPMGSFYGNLFTVQDYNHDLLLDVAASSFNFQTDLLSFELYNEDPDRISLSWHLTGREKKRILACMLRKENQHEAMRFLELTGK